MVIFHTGGGIPPKSEYYVFRQADRDADFAIQQKKLIAIIAPRQTGKTSLLWSIKSKLNDRISQKWRYSYIDLAHIKDLDRSEWYSYIVKKIAHDLKLPLNDMPEGQTGFEDLILEKTGIKSKSFVALFFDEVESLLGHSFCVTFLSTLRHIFQVVSSSQTNGQLLIALAGTVTTDDLIKDTNNSPFNVAEKIKIEDFSRDESNFLSSKLETNGLIICEDVHDCIYEWAAGHPYLTHRICEKIMTTCQKNKIKKVNLEFVDTIVNNYILSQTNPDSNISHIKRKIRDLKPKPAAVWNDVKRGKRVKSTKSGFYQLYLTGAVSEDSNKFVKIRNRIYEKALKQNELIDKQNEINILHLSDIHITKEEEASLYYAQLKTDLTNELSINNIDYLVVSGDIANNSEPSEYTAAFENLISMLMKEFKIDSNKIIIVPGNHDINWDLSADAYNKHIPQHKKSCDPLNEKCIPCDAGTIKRNETLYEKRFDHFSTHFYEKLYNKKYPIKYSEQGIVHYNHNDNLLFVSFNSCWNIDHYYTKRASINDDALGKIINQLSNKYKHYLKIAVSHYPVTGKEMIDDGFLQLLASHKFQILMHGHIHETTKGFYEYDKERGIHLIGAGTFGAPANEQMPGIPLQYNLLKFDPKNRKIIVETRKKEKPNGAWKADARWEDMNNPKPRYTIGLRR